MPPQIDDSLLRLLPRTGQAIGLRVRQATAAHGLTPLSAGVLRALSATGSTSHRELAGVLGVAPATLSPVVDALERSGSVTRTRDATDRRVVRVQITTVGRERLTAADAEVARALSIPDPPPDHEKNIRGFLLAVLAGIEEG